MKLRPSPETVSSEIPHQRTQFDKHHILTPGRDWELRKEGLYLREHPSLKVKIEQSIHRELHRDCPEIGTIGRFALSRVAASYQPGDDTLASVDNLSFAIEEAHKHPKTHRIERLRGELTVAALRTQIPFLSLKP